MDKTGADFEYSIGTIIDRLGVKATAIQYPIGAEADFVGCIDLIQMQAYIFDGDQQENYKIEPIPEHLKETAEK